MPLITSIATSRLMLSIQDLAAHLRLDATWLLSNAELSRIRWRQGSSDGELIVEIESVEASSESEVELGNLAGKTRVYVTTAEEIPIRRTFSPTPPRLEKGKFPLCGGGKPVSGWEEDVL